MTDNKTQPTTQSVDAFIGSVENPKRQADARALDHMFRRVTGWEPRMWGASLIGYGAYDYQYESGRSGQSLATGFSPRKSKLVVYIMPGYADFSDILDRIGKHKMGKSCLYVNKLADVDMTVMEELVRAGLDDLADRWPIRAD